MAKIVSTMKKKNTVLRILSFVRPYWRWMTGAMLCMVFFALFSGASLGMILPLFDDVLTREDQPREGGDLLPVLRENTGGPLSRMGSGIASFDPGETFSAGGDLVEGLRETFRRADPAQVLLVIIVGLLIIVILKNLLGFMQVFFLSRAEQGVVTDIRGKLCICFAEDARQVGRIRQAIAKALPSSWKGEGYYMGYGKEIRCPTE